MPFGVQDSQQFVAHVQAHQGIERGERLVHVQDLGLDDQRPRELRPLPHAT